MLLTADALLCHAIGDYLLQSDYMALRKTTSKWVALFHAVVYGLPFLWLGPSLAGWLVIVLTHAVIDHYRLARYLVYAKNFLAPREFWYRWQDCAKTGYHKDRPDWLAVWLLIIADNTLHVFLNSVALAYL